jgi:hypothetical protein
MLQAPLAALALAASALLASGCGGSSKPAASTAAATTPATTASTLTPTPPPTTLKLATGKALTRAQWIAQGDAICAHVNTEVAAISVRTVSEDARLIPQIAAYYSTEASALSKLVPPVSMASDGSRIVNGIQLVSEYLYRSAQELQAGDTSTGGQTFRAAVAVQKQPIAVARRDGFTKCTDTN